MTSANPALARKTDPRKRFRHSRSLASLETVIGARWVDQLGENILVVTETGAFPSKGKDSEGSDAELYGYHFINRGGSWSQLWKIQDFERNCKFDIDMSYLPGTLTITDLDADGIAETVFSYKMTCTSDVSPSYMKLMMHEGADKYAIRGNMVLSKEYNIEPAFPPEMNVDPGFAKAPASFKTYAIQQWQAHREQTSF